MKKSTNAVQGHIPTVPTVNFSGSSRDIGHKWGIVNRQSIKDDINTYYLKQAAARGISRETLIERSKEFVKIAGKIAPHWLEEARAVALAADIKENIYVSYIGGIYRSLFMHECTSYSVSRKYTRNNAIFFHKNRDNEHKKQTAFIIDNKKAELNKFISTGDTSVITCMMMVNEKGLAGSADCPNEGTPIPKEAEPRQRGIMNTFMLRYIAEKASDCTDALEIIRDFVGKKYYAGGDINITHWLFVDKRGAILEISNNSSHIISKSHKKKVYFSRLFDGSAANRLRDAKAPVDFQLFHAVSRDPSICFESSVSGMTVEIDPALPDVLTCAWISLPAYSISFPVLMGGRETPLPLANGEAYNLAAGRRGDELNSLWESIENSIHTSKTLLTEKIRRDAKSAGSWHTGADIDRWTSKQSVMIMNVLRMLNDKPADEPGSAKKTAKKKRTCR